MKWRKKSKIDSSETPNKINKKLLKVEPTLALCFLPVR